MNLGSTMMSLRDKCCQSILSQRDKYCKVRIIDLSFDNILISVLNFPSNKIFYSIVKVDFSV